jgi:WD40 repeat protein
MAGFQDLVATGSADGEVIVWNLNLMKATFRLTAADGGSSELLSDGPKLRASKANLFQTQRAVDRVLWLQHRAQGRDRRRGGAILVSSAHGGHLFFWELKQGRSIASFCASHSKLGSEVSPGVEMPGTWEN